MAQWSRLPALLRHRYIALRHGQSTANVAGTISSDPAIATETHGLTALGQQQARESVQQLASIPARRVAFLTSDFTRARETAEIAAAGLEEHWLREGSLNRGGGGTSRALVGDREAGAVHHELRLRERWFGDLNGTPDSPDAEGSLGGYPSVWAEDAADAAGVTRGVETVTSVVERATAVIAELEAGTHPICRGAEEEEEWAVVLVAHGDILQILQTAFEVGEDGAVMCPSRHRSLPHLDNAVPRVLNPAAAPGAAL